MAHDISRKIKILWREKYSDYETINKDVLVVNERPMGITSGANKKILSEGDMLQSIMPTLVGADPNSNKSDWDNLMYKYFNGMHVLIPKPGLELEVGFSYRLKTDNKNKKEAIAELIGSKTTIKTDEDLANLVEATDKHGSFVNDPDTWYRYGEPIEKEQYVIYRYAKYSAKVANNKADVEKSPNIRFYIHTDHEERVLREKRISAETESMKLYLELITDPDVVDSVLLLMNRLPSSFKDDSEKHEFLNTQRINNTNYFISTLKDKNLKMKADIEKYIQAGVLRRLVGSTTVVDNSDASIVLGINMDEVVSFFSNELNKAKVKEYESIYKSQKK